VSAQGAGHSPEPPTERAVVPGGNARRPTGANTAVVRTKELEAEERVRLAEIAARDANARRDDTRALVREAGEQLRALMATAFAGLTSLSHSCARFAPSHRTVAIVGAVVLGLAALAWGGSVAFGPAGLRVGEPGAGAEFDPHAMNPAPEDTDALEVP
jgi:hypothetical protein